MRGEAFIRPVPRGNFLPLDKRRHANILSTQGPTIPIRFDDGESHFSIRVKRVARDGMPAGAGGPLRPCAGWESDCTGRTLAAATEPAAQWREEHSDSKERPVTWQREIIPFAKGRRVTLRGRAPPCRALHAPK